MRGNFLSRSLRSFIAALASTIVATVASFSSAQAAEPNYPSRLIRILVAGAAGSSPDVTARLIAARLTETLGQPVIIENRGAASGFIAGEAVARAAPDGYLFMYPVNSVICANPHLYSKLPYDALKSFAPVTMTARFGYVMLGRAGSPVNDLRGLIEAAKAAPDKLNFGSGGMGVGNHVSMELFLEMTGMRIVHVPHRDSAVSVSSGESDVALVPYTTGVPLARGGKLKPLGVTLDKRLPALPDVPAIAEVVPGYVADAWHGLFAPAGTPVAIVERVAAEIGKILREPEMRKRFTDLGLDPIGSTPAEFTAAIKSDYDKWGRVIRNANIKLD